MRSADSSAERPWLGFNSTGALATVALTTTNSLPTVKTQFCAEGSRHVLLRLKDEPRLSVSELARPLSLKLPGLMKHLDVLSDAGLIRRAKVGRSVSVHLAVGPMREAMAWLQRYERLWTVSIDRLVALVEKDGQR